MATTSSSVLVVVAVLLVRLVLYIDGVHPTPIAQPAAVSTTMAMIASALSSRIARGFVYAPRGSSQKAPRRGYGRASSSAIPKAKASRRAGLHPHGKNQSSLVSLTPLDPRDQELARRAVEGQLRGSVRQKNVGTGCPCLFNPREIIDDWLEMFEGRGPSPPQGRG